MNNKPKFIFTVAALFLCCLMSFTNSFAQEASKQVAPNYKIYLDTIVATNNAGGNKKLSASLMNAIKDVKTDAFSNYYIFANSYERVGLGSLVSQNSFHDSLGQIKQDKYPIYLNWSLGKINKSSDEKGRDTIQFDNFTFEANVPLPTTTVVSYQKIRLYNSGFDVPQNVPTVIGTLPVPRTDEMLYFVLMVKPVE